MEVRGFMRLACRVPLHLAIQKHGTCGSLVDHSGSARLFRMPNSSRTPTLLHNAAVALRRWFDTDTTLDGDARDERIDWLRELPFMGLHVACVGVLWVGVSGTSVAVAVLLYALRMFAITGFYHRHADTEHDLHSPRHGFWRSHMGWFLTIFALPARQAAAGCTVRVGGRAAGLFGRGPRVLRSGVHGSVAVDAGRAGHRLGVAAADAAQLE